jgi:plasmid stabilization system protein ParE
MRVRYTRRARGNLEAIYSYLERRSPSAASSAKKTIERRIRQLADFPLIAPATDEPGVRALSIVRLPYKVYYRIEHDEVWILHIRHTSRRTPDLSEL